MRLFIYSDLPPAARALLVQALPPGVQPTFRLDLPADQQASALRQAEVLLGNPPPAWLAGGGPPALRLWQLDSAGFDRYQGVQVVGQVANMGDFFAWPCAETMVAGLLAHYRALPELLRLQAQQRWDSLGVRARTGLLRGQRVLLLGAGAIAQAVRQQLGGFGCPVQLLARTDPAATLHSRAELLQALPATDVVVNCLPGSAAGFVDAELLAALPPGSLYATVGRGNTTDEPALLAALRTGQLAGAVLDVTAREPLPPDHPFWTMPQVLLTQHTGGGQLQEAEGKVRQLLRNLAHLQAGEKLENEVQLSQGY
ncbi:D-2-hydroxyacid dehydrogenase [Hymenobacter sp. RP-2-7]|uniref:D-2-hydroxyacid dehydrogenase n=1 Tax=Hymenobacter polaris TaxID=2682546 RepID=A0A7Y0FLE5_9BACT|nr:D-2-hydroxyacid dehydrogenase [Hymenobacter polaris]NML64722.1 D-2-hydroxyacid dehydrogenase [Hymenobacter polaris]